MWMPRDSAMVFLASFRSFNSWSFVSSIMACLKNQTLLPGLIPGITVKLFPYIMIACIPCISIRK
jgi:hypothetical protein